MAEGWPDKKIEQKTGVDRDTIYGWKTSKINEITEIKKELQKKLVESAAEKLSALANDMLLGSRKALDLIINRIDESSPAQAAMILGILRDKYDLILGNPSQNIRVSFGSRDDMVGYIKGGAKPPPIPVEGPVKPIIEVEAIPHEPKPPRQIIKESLVRLGRTPGGRRKRGRPPGSKNRRVPVIPEVPILPPESPSPGTKSQ